MASDKARGKLGVCNLDITAFGKDGEFLKHKIELNDEKYPNSYVLVALSGVAETTPGGRRESVMVGLDNVDTIRESASLYML